MASYNINKGVDNPAEFKGLTSQYLIIFAGGLLNDILFVIFYLAGIPTSICIAFALLSGTVIIFTIFHLN